jgi:hypothetical protein
VVAGKVAEASDWAVAMATGDSQHWGEPDRGSRAQVTGPRRHPRKEISQGRRKEKVEEKRKKKRENKKRKKSDECGSYMSMAHPTFVVPEPNRK